MADDSKKTPYTTWAIIIGAVILILALAIVFYLLWRKLNNIDIRLSEKAKSIDDTRTQVVRMESEFKARDEKIQELSKEMSAIRESNTELKCKVKELKGKAIPSVQIKSKAKASCADESCSIEDKE